MMRKNNIYVSSSIYKCKILSCKFKTKYKDNLVRHFNSERHNINENDSFYEYIEETDMFKCKDCDHQTKQKRDLERHSWLHKTRDELTWYNCTQCKYSTIYKHGLNKHNLVHRRPEEIEMFHCYQCQFKSKGKSYLAMHINSHNPNNLLKCPEPGCNYETVFKRLLKSHQSSHQPFDSYSCDICPFLTKYRKTIQQHMDNHEKQKAAQIFKCSYCEVESNNKTKMMRHLISCDKNVHLKDTTDKFSKYDIENNIFKCRFCEYQNKTNREIKKHFLIKHKDPNQVKIYSCPQCKFKTRYKPALNAHQKIHKEPTNWIQCAQCDFKTRYKNSFAAHSKKHQDPKNVQYYYCDQCEYKSFQNSNLNTHKKSHRPRDIKDKCDICRKDHPLTSEPKEKSHTCFLCNFQSSSWIDMKEHNLKFHTDKNGQHLFKCTYCLFSSRRKDSITSHLKSHESFKDAVIYKCCDLNCNFQTKIKKNLKNHYYMFHEDEKNVKILECTKCDYKTRSNEYLYKHVKFMHSDKSELLWYKCDVCPYETNYKTSLKSHISRRHSTKRKVFRCPDCNCKTLSEKSIIKHIKVKHGIAYNKDTIKQLEIKGNNKSNKFNYNQKDAFSCFLCNFATNYNKAILEHNSKFHTDAKGQPLFKCPYCAFSAVRKDYVKSHLFTHNLNNAEIFKCLNANCGFQTKRKDSLRNHKCPRFNKNAKILKCSKCNFRTRTKLYLTQHTLITHSGTTFYECYLCSFKTRTKNILKTHITKLHKPKVLVVKLLKYKTLSEDEIMRHEKTKGPNNNKQIKLKSHKNKLHKPKVLVVKLLKHKNLPGDYVARHEGGVINYELNQQSNLQNQEQINVDVNEIDEDKIQLKIELDINDVKLEDYKYAMDITQGDIREIKEANNVDNANIKLERTSTSTEANNASICLMCSFKADNLDSFRQHLFTKHIL